MKAKSPMSFMKARQKRTLKRTNSCPDWHEIEEIVAAKNKPIIEESKPKDSTEEKTDDKFRGINDEEPDIAENSEIFLLCNIKLNSIEFIYLPYFFF